MPPFADLLYTPGQDNLAGLIGELEIIPSADVESLPALSGIGLLTTAAAQIVAKAGKQSFRVYFTDETGKLECKPVGERDGKGWETLVTIKYPGDNAAVNEFARNWGNTPAVVIVKDAKTGLKKLLGVTNLDKTTTVLSLDIPAYFETGEIMSGQKRADSRGATLAWKFTCAHPPITYMGTTPIEPEP